MKLLSYKTITCIMPAGRGRAVHNRLMKEQGVLSASMHHARGIGASTFRHRNSLVASEKDVLVALVEESRADDLFAFLFDVADIGKPHVGLMFMSRTGRGHPLVAPVELNNLEPNV